MARTAGIVLDLFARTEHQRYGPHRQHRADLHVPRDGHAPHPVAILIHGGDGAPSTARTTRAST